MVNPKNNSFSRINTFTECERKHALDSLYRTPSTPAMERGTHVHEALELVGLQQAEGLGPNAAVDFALANLPEGPVEPEELAGYVERCRPWFQRLKPVGVEQRFESVDGLPIVGYIDYHSSTAPVVPRFAREATETVDEPFVLDYKTVGKLRKVEEVERNVRFGRKPLQLAIYCLATGARRAGFLFLFPSPASPPHPVFVEFTDEELAQARGWLEQQVEVIESRWTSAAHLCEIAREVKFDVSGFALASPDYPWCSAKWCPHWDKCFTNPEAERIHGKQR